MQDLMRCSRCLSTCSITRCVRDSMPRKHFNLAGPTEELGPFDELPA